jgi:hypothetical protein
MGLPVAPSTANPVEFKAFLDDTQDSIAQLRVDVDAIDAGDVPATRTITAGTGLTGGGDLSANRSIAADFGTGAGKVTQGNDSRLSDARTPTAHAASHADGGSDEISIDGSQVTSGTIADVRIASTIARDSEVIPIGYLDTDGTLAGNSDTKVPSQKAIKTYADQLIAAADAMVFKGVIDCSANPNYPAADKGWTYRVSVAGKIGGASGVVVEAGDIAICLADGTVSGNQATVGTSWSVAQANVDGAVIGPTSATDSGLVVFDGTTGKIVKAGSISLTGDATATLSGSGSAAVTFATVNSNVGSFGDATHVPAITVDGKGRVTAVVSTAIAIPESAVTGLVTDLAATVDTASLLMQVQGEGTDRVFSRSRYSIAQMSATTAGHTLVAYFTPLKSLLISKLALYSGSTATTGATLIRFGLWTVDGSDNLTLVAGIANDTAIFATGNTRYERALDTGGGLPSTYQLVAGTRYAAGFIIVGGSPGTVYGLTGTSASAGASSGRFIAGLKAGFTDLANLSSLAGDARQPFVELIA